MTRHITSLSSNFLPLPAFLSLALCPRRIPTKFRSFGSLKGKCSCLFRGVAFLLLRLVYGKDSSSDSDGSSSFRVTHGISSRIWQRCTCCLCPLNPWSNMPLYYIGNKVAISQSWCRFSKFRRSIWNSGTNIAQPGFIEGGVVLSLIPVKLKLT